MKPTIRTLADIQPPPERADLANRNCEHCYFGMWAPIGRVRHSADYAYQCTLQPPKNYNGFPMVRHYAVCAMFTEKDEPHNQPLRHLMPNKIEGENEGIKG